MFSCNTVATQFCQFIISVTMQNSISIYIILTIVDMTFNRALVNNNLVYGSFFSKCAFADTNT